MPVITSSNTTLSLICRPSKGEKELGRRLHGENSDRFDIFPRKFRWVVNQQGGGTFPVRSTNQRLKLHRTPVELMPRPLFGKGYGGIHMAVRVTGVFGPMCRDIHDTPRACGDDIVPEHIFQGACGSLCLICPDDECNV